MSLSSFSFLLVATDQAQHISINDKFNFMTRTWSPGQLSLQLLYRTHPPPTQLLRLLLPQPLSLFPIKQQQVLSKSHVQKKSNLSSGFVDVPKCQSDSELHQLQCQLPTYSMTSTCDHSYLTPNILICFRPNLEVHSQVMSNSKDSRIPRKIYIGRMTSKWFSWCKVDSSLAQCLPKWILKMWGESIKFVY